MKVVYPSIVEQFYEGLKSEGVTVGKDEVYRTMVETNLIDENGVPTQYALDNGFIKCVDNEPESLAEFKELYPNLQKYSDDHFMKTDEGWYIDTFVARSESMLLLNDPATSETDKLNARIVLNYLKEDDADE
jgi:Fe2+ or Zn2+ uptake regulation protein